MVPLVARLSVFVASMGLGHTGHAVRAPVGSVNLLGSWALPFAFAFGGGRVGVYRSEYWQ